MSKLPFVVEPRAKAYKVEIGSEESGIIEVEARGYLTSGEKAFVQQVQQQDDGTLKLIELARKVSKDKGYALDHSYNLIISCITGDVKTDEARNLEEEYTEQIQQTLHHLASSRTRESLVYAACMLIYRVPGDYTINDIFNIHPDIVSGLADLYLQEDSKSVQKISTQEGDEQEPAKVEEIEKKRKTTRSA